MSNEDLDATQPLLAELNHLRRGARAERRIRGRILSSLVGIALVSVPVAAYTQFDKPTDDFESGKKVRGEPLNELFDDIYAGLNTLESRYQSCGFGTTRVTDQCIDDIGSVGTWAQATGLCNAEGKSVCSVETLHACDLVNPAETDCTYLTDGATGTTTWTNTSVPVEGELVSAQVVAYAGDGRLIFADVSEGGVARNYLCCSTILAP